MNEHHLPISEDELPRLQDGVKPFFAGNHDHSPASADNDGSTSSDTDGSEGSTSDETQPKQPVSDQLAQSLGERALPNQSSVTTQPSENGSNS